MILRGLEIVGTNAGPQEIVVAGSAIARVGEPSRGDPSHSGPLFDFGGAIAFPGLVNSHDHLDFNLYPALGHKLYGDYLDWGHDIHRLDRDVISSLQRMPKPHRLRWGALKNLLCGVTTVAHHGARGDDLSFLPLGTISATSIHSVGAAPWWRWRLNAPLGPSPYVFHIAEGTSRSAHEEVDTLIRWNVFRKPLIGVHAIAMTADQAARFHAVVWCPVSNEFLYGATADIAALKRHTTILFGTDSTLSADWNLWNHLRRARALGVLDDRELFAALTRNAAIAWGRRDTGCIAPGQIGDIVVARKKASDLWDAFFAVTPEDILLVLRNGEIVLCDGPVDAAVGRRLGSVVRIGSSAKWVAEDVPEILARMRHYGIEPNLPVTAEPGGSVLCGRIERPSFVSVWRAARRNVGRPGRYWRS
jgi:cytosine/adenosine deaminase-related metal-dependent hydrolase